MLESNYLIINRVPQKFSNFRLAGRTAVFLNEDGKMLNDGTITMDSSVYAALFCDDVRNLTLVLDRDGERSVRTILWCTDEGYLQCKTAISGMSGIRLSRQNRKLNRYAEAIVEKLENGVEISVIDYVDKSDMIECPDCGMMNPAGTMYCMDCGAELD